MNVMSHPQIDCRGDSGWAADGGLGGVISQPLGRSGRRTVDATEGHNFLKGLPTANRIQLQVPAGRPPP